MKAIITGASRGIGKAIAHALANTSYDLILIARGEKGLLELKGELNQYKVEIECWPLDLGDPVQSKKAQTQIANLDSLNLLVNNLGVYWEDSASSFTTKSLEEILEINLLQAISLSQKSIPLLKLEKTANIINIGSVMSIEARSKATAYSISKHAFKGWNDALREELRLEGIKVTAIYPGSVNTSSWDGIDVDKSELIQTEDIAKMVSSILDMNANSLIEEIRINPLRFDLSKD